jgi:hypothetical protein
VLKAFVRAREYPVVEPSSRRRAADQVRRRGRDGGEGGSAGGSQGAVFRRPLKKKECHILFAKKEHPYVTNWFSSTVKRQCYSLRGRLHVRFCVPIGVRFGVRFAAKGVPQVIFRFVFSEMCRQAIVMGVIRRIGCLSGLHTNRA